MVLRISLLACVSVLVGSGVSASVMPLDQAARLFASRPSSFAPDLSPDGDKLVYLASGPGATTLAHIRDLRTGADRILIRSSGKPEQLRFCGFVDERWIVCSFSGERQAKGSRFPMGRTVAVDTTGATIRPLSAIQDGAFLQFDGRVIDWLPDEPGYVLMERIYAGGYRGAGAIGLDRIRIDPFKVSVVETPTSSDVDYMSDGHGSVRLRRIAVTNHNNNLTGVGKYEYLVDGKWRQLGDFDREFKPLAIDRNTNSLYFLKPLDGRMALYTLRLDGSSKETLVASNPKVDIESVIQIGHGGPVLGYRYTDDRTRTIYTDAAMRSLSGALANALPDRPLVSFVATSRTGDKLLLHAASDVDPGVFFLLDRKTGRMDPVLNSNDLIDGKDLAPMKSISIPTSDGKLIDGYVTMRPDLGDGPHPAIVMPHGGPSARDEWEFNWLAQFLAARGYVVIQPNYRGSGGYGKEFLGENAFHEWRKAMADIHDSADWLVKQHLADPNRMAILGWSYGGYAALQSAAMDHRYKAVVAIAPVTDVKKLRRDAEGFRGEDIQKNEIGKGDQLVDGSPINHPQDIVAPVLLVHGTADGNVVYDHSTRMLAALKRVGRDASLLTFEGLDHQIADSDSRTKMLTGIGELLARTIGQ